MDKITINTAQDGGIISPMLHGQFIEFLGTCIHDGIWVGEDAEIPNYNGLRKDVVDALKDLEIPVLRWPGGCFADKYHWRDGVGPKSERPVVFNENFGTNTLENHQFGTHEFMELCRLTGAKPWFNINMLTGTVAEMVDWAEYCNRDGDTTLALERAANGHKDPFEVEYWGIGNEAWGGGGYYTAAGYAQEYRKYVTAFPMFQKEHVREMKPSKMKMIAVGADGNKAAERVAWTRDFFQAYSAYRQCKLDAIDLHYYNWNIEDKEDRIEEFTEAGWYRVLSGATQIEEVIHEQYEIIQEEVAKLKRPKEGAFWQDVSCDLYIGEWGNWHAQGFQADQALFQQCTMRDALTSAITLDVFHRNCEKVKLACVAQTVNVLNSLLLTEGEDTIKTPNYHVFQMYKVHRGARKIGCKVSPETSCKTETAKIDHILSFASEKDGVISINIINTMFQSSHTDGATKESTKAIDREITIYFDVLVEYVGGTTLKSNSVYNVNTISNKECITPQKAWEPIGRDQTKENTWIVAVPNSSVTVYQFKIV